MFCGNANLKKFIFEKKNNNNNKIIKKYKKKLVYDVTNEQSFKNLRRWLEAVKTYASPDVSVMLLGNKSDLSESREVTWDTAQQYAESLNIEILESSAKNSVNVEKAFKQLAQNGAESKFGECMLRKTTHKHTNTQTHKHK